MFHHKSKYYQQHFDHLKTLHMLDYEKNKKLCGVTCAIKNQRFSSVLTVLDTVRLEHLLILKVVHFPFFAISSDLLPYITCIINGDVS